MFEPTGSLRDAASVIFNLPGYRVTIADMLVTARLADNATARDLATPLPLTLTSKDFNHVEKVATLPRRLSTDGAPAGADPDIGNMGYYAP